MVSLEEKGEYRARAMAKRWPIPAPMAKKPEGPGGQRIGCSVPLPETVGKVVDPGFAPVDELIDVRATETEVDCHAPPTITCGPCINPRPAGFQYTAVRSPVVGPENPVSATWASSSGPARTLGASVVAARKASSRWRVGTGARQQYRDRWLSSTVLDAWRQYGACNTNDGNVSA